MFLKLIGLPGWGQGTPSVSPWKEPAHVGPHRAPEQLLVSLCPSPPSLVPSGPGYRGEGAIKRGSFLICPRAPAPSAPPPSPRGDTAPAPNRRDLLSHGPTPLLWAEPCTSCSITLMTQLIIISFAINLLVKRNSTHLLLINGALK